MTVSVSRHRFDFQAAGGPWLVFLHEGLGSIAQWKDFPAQLCRACGLPGLVYERWGFGRSEPLTGPRRRDYLHYEAFDSLPAVLESCGIVDPPILIGHSDGGTIALLFAAAFPDRPRALITEAAHVFVEEVTLEGIRHKGSSQFLGAGRDGQGQWRESLDLSQERVYRAAECHDGGAD